MGQVLGRKEHGLPAVTLGERDDGLFVGLEIDAGERSNAGKRETACVRNICCKPSSSASSEMPAFAAHSQHEAFWPVPKDSLFVDR